MHILHCCLYFIPDCAIKTDMFLFSYQIVFAYYFTLLVFTGYWAEEGWAIFLLGRIALLEFQVHSKSGTDEAVFKKEALQRRSIIQGFCVQNLTYLNIWHFNLISSNLFDRYLLLFLFKICWFQQCYTR